MMYNKINIRTLKDGSMKYEHNKKDKERKPRGASVSDIDPVPRYRAYGVTKKETWLTRFNNGFADVLFAVLFLLSFAIMALGLYGVIYMLGATGIFISIIAVILVIYLVVFRTLRKRLKFLRRLKKHCKKYKYQLNFKKSFFKSLKNNNAGLDFTLETGKKLWCVRFLAVRHYDSSMMFLNNGKIQIVSPPIESPENTIVVNMVTANPLTGARRRTRFSTFSQFAKKKKITLDFSFTETEQSSKVVKKALIVNPVPRSMFKKLPDETSVSIGTGEYINGYTVFSGSGFLEALLRDDY